MTNGTPILPFTSAQFVDGNGKLTLQGVDFLRKVVVKLQSQITQLSEADANIARVLAALTGDDGILIDVAGLNVDELLAIQAVNGAGLMARDQLGQWLARAMADAAGEISWTYPDGLAGNPQPALVATGVTPGTYGSSATIPVPTVDSKGRITSITAVAAASAAVPTVMASGDTYTVAANTQVLFSIPIDIDLGTLDVAGDFVEVA